MQVKQRFSYNTPPQRYQKAFQKQSKIRPKWCQNRGLEGLGAQRARKPTRRVFLRFQKTKKTQNC